MDEFLVTGSRVMPSGVDGNSDGPTQGTERGPLMAHGMGSSQIGGRMVDADGYRGQREDGAKRQENDYSKKTVGDRYRVGEELGRGASGRVYRGLDTKTGEQVAVKQISLERLQPSDISSIMTEVELLKSLNHKNVVQYLGSFQTRHYLYIVMELVEAGSLASIIKKSYFGPFPEGLVAVYIDQVLRGLAYLHAQGVVHRDVKGANILTTREGHVKLADFGVAARLGEEGHRHATTVEEEEHAQPAGTPYWMAPEVIELKTVTTASDIWSVGCLAVELLTGQPPYFDMQPLSALYNIVQEPHPPLPSGASEQMRDFLLLCFHKDPTARPSAQALMRHQWITNNRKSLRDTWGKTLRPYPDNDQLNQDAHASVASVVERLIAAETSSVSEASMNARSSESFESALEGKSESTRGGDSAGMAKDEEGDAEEALLQQENLTDATGEDILLRLQDRADLSRRLLVSSSDNLVARGQVRHSAQDEADVVRQVNSLRVTAFPGHRSLVEEAAAAASARTIHGYILKYGQLARVFIDADGLSCLRELFDSSSERVLVPCLDLLLVVVEAHTDNLTDSCLVGLIPAALRFCSKQHPYSLRQRAAAYGLMLAAGSSTSAQMFVACQGIPFMMSLIDDSPSEQEQYNNAYTAMCSFWALLRRSLRGNWSIRLNQCLRLMSHHALPQKIVKVLPSILKRASELGKTAAIAAAQSLKQASASSFPGGSAVDNGEQQSVHESSYTETRLSREDEELLRLMESLVNMYYALSYGDQVVKAKCCHKDTINSLFTLTMRMPTYLQEKVIRSVCILSAEESVLSALESASTIAYVVAQLPREDSRTLQVNALVSLKHLCQLSRTRQEKACDAGAIPWLCRLAIHPPVESSEDIDMPELTTENEALLLLCGMAHSTQKVRSSLWKNGALDIFLQTLKQDAYRVSVMEALAAWLDADSSRIEPRILEDTAITRIVLLMPAGNLISRQSLEQVPSLVSPLMKIVSKSSRIGMALSTAGLASRVTDLLVQPYPPAVLSLMELLKLLYEIDPHPKEFLSRNRITPILRSLATGEREVLVQVQAQNLLKAFSINEII